MTHYTATFSDGKSIERKNSKLSLSHAWKTKSFREDGSECVMTGFSGSEALARSAGSGAFATKFDSKKRKWVRCSEIGSVEVVETAALQ